MNLNPSFSQIPANLRIPGSHLEFDSSLAGYSQQTFKRLIIGQRLAAGTVAAGVPTLVPSGPLADTYFGRGSMLAKMCRAALAVDPWMETWAIPLDDNVAGVAATGSLTITGAPTEAGTLNVYVGADDIGGSLNGRVQVAVATTDTPTSIATAIAAAINADDTLPVTAASALGVVTLTARQKGEVGNDIDVRLNYYGETTPAGIVVAIAAMAAGATNPDITDAITAMAGTQYNWMTMPYVDQANMTAMATELDSRYSAMEQIGGRAFGGWRGTYAAALTFGQAQNSPHMSMMPMQNSPTPNYIMAGGYCAIASQQLAIDPARPLQTLPIPGVLAPALLDRWTDTERNQGLFDGMSSFKVGSDGTVRIEAAITQYQKDASGVADTAYLYVNYPEILERHRYNVNSTIAKRYPRSKLAADSQPVQAGQALVRPKDIMATMLSVYQSEVDLGWMQGFDGYKSTIQVGIDANNPNRVNVVDNPELVNGFRIFADLVQFKL
jgi:phage tail sheath gpL-like